MVMVKVIVPELSGYLDHKDRAERICVSRGRCTDVSKVIAELWCLEPREARARVSQIFWQLRGQMCLL